MLAVASTGTLTPALVRDVYLRGIDLGSAWTGPSADAALGHLLQAQIAHAEALMNIHFRRWQVVMLPETTALPGTDYDVLAPPLAYQALLPGEPCYRLGLAHHDVQAITRVRLYRGVMGVPPVQVWTLVPLDACTFPMPDEHLLIAAEAVPLFGDEQAWAVDYLIGMGLLPTEVQEWVALGAAMQVLALGGAAADVSHGLAQELLTQDGITESVSYGGKSAWGGLYAGPLAVLRDRQAAIDLVALRLRYQNTLGDWQQLPADAIIPTPIAKGY